MKAAHGATAGKRQNWISAMADAFLEQGVGQIPLRDLAKRLGTSDRMLLYYFDDKSQLVQAVLAEIATRLTAAIAASSSMQRRAPSELFDAMLHVLAAPQLVPYMNVWADVAARGGRGEEPFRSVAQRTIGAWIQWCDERLAISDATVRRTLAAAILAMVEGLRLLESAAPGSTQGAGELSSSAWRQLFKPRQ
jgi:AcrR family transcriptional regulator